MVTNCIMYCIISWSLKAKQLEIHEDYYICKSNLSVNKAEEIYFHIYKSCLVVWSCASTCIVGKEDTFIVGYYTVLLSNYSYLAVSMV